MRFSLKTLILVSTWIAWFCGAVVGANPLVALSFIVCQYMLLAASIAVVVVNVGSQRFFATCFAMGFLSWFLFLASERQFADMQTFRSTLPGSTLQTASIWIADFKSFTDEQAKYHHYQNVGAVVRAATGTICGLLANISGLFFLSISLPSKSESQKKSEASGDDQASH